MAETSFETNRNRKKRILRISYIFIGVMLFLTFFSNTINNFSLPRVSVEQPVSGALIKEVTASGVIEAKDTEKVYSRQGRLVNEVRVKPGDKVSKGDIIAVLDRAEIEQQLEEQMLRYEQAKLLLEKLIDAGSSIETVERNVKVAKGNLDGKKALFDSGAISGEEVRQAENALLQVQRELDNERKRQRDNERDIKIQQSSNELAELTIERLRKELEEETTLISPVDGIINELNVTPGSLVNGGVPVFSVDDASEGFEVKIAVDQKKAQYLSVGDTAEITVKSLGNKVIAGTIREIAESTVNKGEVKDLFIDIPADGISGSERCDIYISKKTRAYDILVPNTAVGTDDKGKFVWVMKGKKGSLGSEFSVQKAYVTVGDSDSSKTAIISGISSEEQIIVSYSKNISDGCRVMPVN